MCVSFYFSFRQSLNQIEVVWVYIIICVYSERDCISERWNELTKNCRANVVFNCEALVIWRLLYLVMVCFALSETSSDWEKRSCLQEEKDAEHRERWSIAVSSLFFFTFKWVKWAPEIDLNFEKELQMRLANWIVVCYGHVYVYGVPKLHANLLCWAELNDAAAAAAASRSTSGPRRWRLYKFMQAQPLFSGVFFCLRFMKLYFFSKLWFNYVYVQFVWTFHRFLTDETTNCCPHRFLSRRRENLFSLHSNTFRQFF